MHFTHLSKSVPHIQAGCSLLTSLLRGVSTQKLSQALEEQFAQWDKSPEAFYTFFQADANKSQSQASHLPIPGITNHVSIQKLLLKYPPGVLILGQTTLPIREWQKGMW